MNDSTPKNPETINEETISSLMGLWPGSTNANAEAKKDILDTRVRLCDEKETTVTFLYNLTTTGKSTALAALQMEDGRESGIGTHTTQQGENKNIVLVKECIQLQTDINLYHAPKRLRKFVKLSRLTVQYNIL